MQDNPGPRLLLGLAGWPHPAWEGDYFPDDLPRDWQFAYYSNDASCLLLAAAQWQALDDEQIEDWLEDAPEHFRFFLEWPEQGGDVGRLQVFGSHLGALLVQENQQIARELPQLRHVGGGEWAERDGTVRLLCWRLDDTDLRRLRERLQAMPPGVQAIVFEDEGADPRQLADIRTLTELLGLA